MIDKLSVGVEVAKKVLTPENIAKATELAKTGIHVAGAIYDAAHEVGNTYEKTKSEIGANQREKIETEGSNFEKVDSIGQEKSELTSEQRGQIESETHWSSEIVDNIRSVDEYEKVYKPADLHEEKVDGRTCLVKNIDMDYVSPKTGLTNREAMAKGMSPCDAKTGERLELHHMGQNYDAPLAELCENSEHGDGNDKILHDKNVESWRNDPQLKNQYQNVDRPNHWKERAEEV